MRRLRRLLLAGVVALCALYAVRVATWRPLEVAGPIPDDAFTRLAGIVHVHTSASDGGGSPEEVIGAARAAGLAFVILTDHNNLDAKAVEGYRNGPLVLVGTEISTTAGHLIGLGIPDPAFRFSGDAKDALHDVRDLGGVSFAAHPTSPAPAFRWTGWELPGPWGLELLNGDSQWREAGWGRLLGTAALYRLNPRFALLSSLSSPSTMLARWDVLLEGRDVAGIAGADAHSRVMVAKQKIRFPSYAALFELARNHVLLETPPTGDPEADGRAIVAALGRGRSYIALDALAPAGGFCFLATDGRARFAMGDTVPLLPGLRLAAGGRLPGGARTTLLRDGNVLAEGKGALEVPAPGPGVYRVEVRVPGWDIPWVLSNPIYVFDAAAAAARAARARWPTPADMPPAIETLDAFEDRSVFEPEADPSSTLTAPTLDPKGGADGKRAARIAFRIGTPSAEHASPFVALVARGKRDLTGRSGLVFSIKGDAEYRLWVQVRDENPASADEGTEWWFASVKTSREWRRVAVPFADLRSINPKTDGRLDLDRVRALVFVLDKGSVKPGTQGTLWIDDVGVY